MASKQNPPDARRERILRLLQAGSLEKLLRQRDGRAILKAEAEDRERPDRFIDEEQLELLLALETRRRDAQSTAAFWAASHDVILVPGFMGSSLADEGRLGLIWVDPFLLTNPEQLLALELRPFDPDRPEAESDAEIRVRPTSSVTGAYDLLISSLRWWGNCRVQVHPVDWRKNLEEAARALAGKIQAHPIAPPLQLIAHSQGALVARRALQILGPDRARRMVERLILLGPANGGTLSAAYALADAVTGIEMAQRFLVEVPERFGATLRTFTGLYQLLPWDNVGSVPGFDVAALKNSGWWDTGIDQRRLDRFFGWGSEIDTAFFHERMRIILGDRPTDAGVQFRDGTMVRKGDQVQGDGTVPDGWARLPGVPAYRCPDATHAWLGANRTAIAAVIALVNGQVPAIRGVPLAAPDDDGVMNLMPWGPSDQAAELSGARKGPKRPRPSAPKPQSSPDAHPRQPPDPDARRLRVYSFDPLLATHLHELPIATLTLDVPWERVDPGPIGEYVEVVDHDPSSDAFYHPVDLADPRLLATDGWAPSESNPQFHQQMVYAVAMTTINTFEKALGRRALWMPRLEKDAHGRVINDVSSQFVRRLRIYPHALRGRNAYYDPTKHALLFGYFPSREAPGGETLPGGTVFTCLSFDIVAHETSHALLHGLHRHFLESSNPDVLAFHEAISDAVALFQHFSHPEQLRHQLARTRGDLRRGELLGNLARQFGKASGRGGALRRYVNREPDPKALDSVSAAHDRGAILMAALFRAFLTIYEHRVEDLMRIATGGSGILAEGAIHPDLVNRLAEEAAKSARHILQMAIRALDYAPPVDITFGEFLRGLITADYDLVRDDDRGYRVAVVDAFRSWGIYPSDCDVLDESSLRWEPPGTASPELLRKVLEQIQFGEWNRRADRESVFRRMNESIGRLREWVFQCARSGGDQGESLGLLVSGGGFGGIPRNEHGAPRFQIHSVRPCLRIGPDGQQRTDVVADIVQRRAGYFDERTQAKVDAAEKPWAFNDGDAKEQKRPRAPDPDFWFRGGCSLVIDPRSGAIRYCIRKSIRNETRLKAERQWRLRGDMPSGAAATYLSPKNPLMRLHLDHSEDC